jgi:DNA-binding FadR family transcriptional regulator
MAAGALKPTVGKADQFSMNTVSSVTSATLQARPGGAAAPAQGQTGEAHAYALGTAQGAAAFPRSAAQRGRGLHGQLVQQLGQMIVAGELGADRPLVPEEIGHRFEVSRTVVRESLRVLEAKGLVSARPNVGTRIRPVHEWNLLDPDVIEWRALGPFRADQARELAELRQAFEPLAAHLVAAQAAQLPEMARARMIELSEILAEAAAEGDAIGYQRADAELHVLLLRATDNRMLEHLAAVVYGALEITGTRPLGCRPSGGDDQHAVLVDRVLAGDGPGAAEVLSSLLNHGAGFPPAPHLPAQRDR